MKYLQIGRQYKENIHDCCNFNIIPVIKLMNDYKMS